MVQGDILRCAKEAKLSFDNLPAAASPERLAELMAMLEDGKVSRGLVRMRPTRFSGGNLPKLRSLRSQFRLPPAPRSNRCWKPLSEGMIGTWRCC